jgi:dTDP-4-dehydrorhamnose 3,5-epimerase
MQLLVTELPDVLVVRPTTRTDERGVVRFAWNSAMWQQAGLPSFVLENHITSRQWVLRGIHRQMRTPQGKLVRCLAGRVFDVAVDLRPGSPSFARWVGRELESEHGDALWVPPGFGHGLLALSSDAVISIQATAAAVPGDERTLRWNDPVVGINWPLPAGLSPLTNVRDSSGESLDAFATE